MQFCQSSFHDNLEMTFTVLLPSMDSVVEASGMFPVSLTLGKLA